MLALLLFLATGSQLPATPQQEARIRSTLQPAVTKMAPASCVMPIPKPSDFLAVVGTSAAKTLSSVTFQGQDEITQVAEIVVARGANPVFLVLYSPEPLLWRISGATGRVRQAVMIGSRSAGIVGVPARQVQFVTEGGCGLSESFYRGRTWANDVQVLAAFGRRPDAIGGDISLYRATVSDSGLDVDRSFPSHSGDRVTFTGDVPALPQGLGRGASTLQLLLMRYYPGGIAAIDPANVVATGKAERYTQLPAVAGAVQLEREGALVAATAADIARWKHRALTGGWVRADRIEDLDFFLAYRVTRPITLPGGLCGAFSLTLFVPHRDFIRGEPCHSNIYLDDGTIVAGPGLMRDD